MKNLYIPKIFQLCKFNKCLLIEDEITSTTDFLNEISSYRNTYITSGIEFHPRMAEFYHDIFKPSSKVKQRMTQICANIDSSYIGIHIRRTDNVVAMQYSPVNAFKTEMQNILERNPNAKFFLATDDQSVKEDFVKEFGSDRIAYNRTPAE